MSSLFFSPPSSPLSSLAIPSYNLRKRKADIEPTVESPLTKRFRKLNIRNQPSPPSKITKRPYNNNLNPITTSNGSNIEEQWNQLTPPPFQRPSSPPPAVMEVDETPYKIFINDLDSSDDSDQDSDPSKTQNNPIIFLSDVEKAMTKIPDVVLNASSSSSTQPGLNPDPRLTKLTTARAGSGSSTDLILYRPPDQIVDDTGVRRLVMEAKERFRMQRNAHKNNNYTNNNTTSAMDGIRSEPSPSPVNYMMDQSIGQFGQGFTGSPMTFTPTMPSNDDPDAMVLDDL
ncbi:hypothetical protein TWF481_007285 [Arthrobotrys musiformis]|uniref:Uncharacterized protein n=1 Tax=Arthrobotrys musiformis TaxID=47236 RepID=A0AAV9WB08_9PEZI